MKDKIVSFNLGEIVLNVYHVLLFIPYEKRNFFFTSFLIPQKYDLKFQMNFIIRLKKQKIDKVESLTEVL